MKFLLEDFNVKMSREDIFKRKLGMSIYIKIVILGSGSVQNRKSGLFFLLYSSYDTTNLPSREILCRFKHSCISVFKWVSSLESDNSLSGGYFLMYSLL
jgi:hypothetical protein